MTGGWWRLTSEADVALLAFDTATRATTVAWQGARGEPPIEARDDPPSGERPRHTACLLPLIADVLERSGTSWRALERVAVGVGPGTFTGLRIGIATARALVQALAVPLVGVPTLRSLAASADCTEFPAAGAGQRPEAVVCVLDARRAEVFAAAWSITDHGLVSLFAARALRPEALVDLLLSTEGLVPANTLALGDGALAFREIVAASGVVVPDDTERHRVTAVNHCQLAWSLPPRHPDDVHPCYVRLPDAELHADAPTRTR
jgi:tRNA threonylcarbamoyladenosine biosynthesis protein TsaB